MNKEIQNPQCKHIWKKTGSWYGIELETKERGGGPIAECIACGRRKNFFYSEWDKMDENNKFNQDCQSCGKWMEYKNLGTNADSSKNTTYCFDCYHNGKFTEPNITLQQIVEKVAENKSKKLNLPKKEIITGETEFISKLKRWQK